MYYRFKIQGTLRISALQVFPLLEIRYISCKKVAEF